MEYNLWKITQGRSDQKDSEIFCFSFFKMGIMSASPPSKNVMGEGIYMIMSLKYKELCKNKGLLHVEI